MIHSSTRRSSSRPLSGLVWVVLTVGAALRVALLFLSREALVTFRLPDDALYYFAIAKHLVTGHAVSFDGVHLTNGFHPLWLATILPVFALRLADWSSIYGVLILQTALDCVVMWQIARLISRRLLRFENTDTWPIALGVAAYALNPSILLRSINGLETTVAALVLVVWLAQYSKVYSEGLTRRTSLLFGITSGLLFLARTDFAIVLLVSGLLLMYRQRGASTKEWARLFGAVGVAFVIVAPWLYWNYQTFGSIIQVSADAVPFMAQRKYDLLYGHSGKFLYLFLQAARNMLKPFMYVGLGLPLLLLLLPLVLPKSRVAFMKLLTNSGLLPPLLGGLLLLAFHSIFRGFIRDWYVLQLLPLIAVLTGAAIAIWSASGVRTIGVTLLVLLLATGIYEWQHPRYVSQGAIVFAGVPFVQQLPTGARLGALNSGWYGYFAPSGVYVSDLDGVVNPDVLPYIKSGNLHGYISNDSIEYLLDFKGDLNGYRGLVDSKFTAGFQVARMLGTPKSDDSLELLRRIPVFK